MLTGFHLVQNDPDNTEDDDSHEPKVGQIVYRENAEYGTQFETRAFMTTDDGEVAATPSTEIILRWQQQRWRRFLDACYRGFVPHGYPESVTEDYRAFQLWNSVQIFFLGLIGTLSMKIILIGLQFSALEAWVNGAAITWLLRRMSRYLARMVYYMGWAERLQLGCEFKKWRSVSSAVNSLSVGLELILYSMILQVRLVLCVAMLIRTMANMCDTITTAVIVHHQALADNFLDVQRKGERQANCALVFGTFSGIFLIHSFEPEEDKYIRRLYSSLTACHLLASYKAVQTLQLRTLNFQRFALLLRMYLVGGNIYNPKEVTPYDGIFENKRITVEQLCGFSIKLGASIAPSDIPPFHEMNLLCKAYDGNRYLLCINRTSRVVYICLRDDATPVDEIRAVYQAVLLALATCIISYIELPILERYPKDTGQQYPLQKLRTTVLQSCARVGMLRNCSKCCHYSCITYIAMLVADLMTFKDFSHLMDELDRVGWSTDYHHLRKEGWTARWTTDYSIDDTDTHLLEFFSKIRSSPLSVCLHQPSEYTY